MLSMLVIAFLARSNRLLISWLQSPSSAQKVKSATVSTVYPSICCEVMGSDAIIFVFWMLGFKPAYSLSSFTFIKRLFSSSLSAIRVVVSAYLKLLIFLMAILITACASSSPAFLMMYSAYKLNKHGDRMGKTRDLFKKIRDTKGTFHAKMGTLKDRNGMDLTEAEDVKRWKECTEELYEKDLHDPDNHNGAITHLEPDILECEVKWALESITTNKASWGDGIPVELFQYWKMMLWKCCTQYVSKFGKLSSGHRTRKGQFSFQFQRKAMPKNAQTTAQLHSSHTLVK